MISYLPQLAVLCHFSNAIWLVWFHLWWLGLALCNNRFLGRYIWIIAGIVVSSFHWTEEIFFFWGALICGGEIHWSFRFWLQHPVNSLSFFAYFVLVQLSQILYNVFLPLFVDNLFIFWRWILEDIRHIWWSINCRLTKRFSLVSPILYEHIMWWHKPKNLMVRLSSLCAWTKWGGAKVQIVEYRCPTTDETVSDPPSPKWK